MRNVMLGMCTILGGWSAFASGQGLLKGTYEITVSWGSSAARAISSYEVAPGETIEVGIGEETLALTILSSSDSDFSLQIVSVSRDDASFTATEKLAPAQQFTEKFGVPIDLRRDAGDSGKEVRFPTGISVSVRKLWQE